MRYYHPIMQASACPHYGHSFTLVYPAVEIGKCNMIQRRVGMMPSEARFLQERFAFVILGQSDHRTYIMSHGTS
jgi:hypothetical protein